MFYLLLPFIALSEISQLGVYDCNGQEHRILDPVENVFPGTRTTDFSVTVPSSCSQIQFGANVTSMQYMYGVQGAMQGSTMISTIGDCCPCAHICTGSRTSFLSFDVANEQTNFLIYDVATEQTYSVHITQSASDGGNSNSGNSNSGTSQTRLTECEDVPLADCAQTSGCVVEEDECAEADLEEAEEAEEEEETEAAEDAQEAAEDAQEAAEDAAEDAADGEGNETEEAEDEDPIEAEMEEGCNVNMECGESETCVDDLLYPSTCGPGNCDAPVGVCESDIILRSPQTSSQSIDWRWTLLSAFGGVSLGATLALHFTKTKTNGEAVLLDDI